MRTPSRLQWLLLIGLPITGCSGSNAATTTDASVDSGAGGDTGSDALGFETDLDSGPNIDVTTCAGAAAAKSYIGCDYWPTVTANQVWSIYDFAVVVANAGADVASVSVSGPGAFSSATTVAPGAIAKIYLPWVANLKGPDSDSCGDIVPSGGTTLAKASAYHLVSDKPVSVYQFNPLEYKPAGGPATKDWTKCPGDPKCGGCFSFTNDASLLLPTSAMTGNYRVAGFHGWTSTTNPTGQSSYVSVTGTQDGTVVKMQVGKHGSVLAGGGVVATAAGGVVTFTLDKGDVAQVMGGASTDSDLSGSLLEATAPVQVITGSPCMENPIGTGECDHLEETVFPAETLGKKYVVTVPTGPHGHVVGHVARLYGHVDSTHLTYQGTTPTGAPTALNAGDVVDLGVVAADFVVQGDQPFLVGTFQLGSNLADSAKLEGDPSQSFASATEQYRKKYVFLAPDDFLESWADVIAPTGTNVTIDGAVPTVTAIAIGASGYGVLRIPLTAGNAGGHLLVADQPVGLQVIGYGLYASYQYPGGSNFDFIADPPPAIH
ncbi:MAG: IgGFc-binding protein [Polyangiales bacterium]